MGYTAPVKDMLFVLTELAGLDTLMQLPGFEEVNLDVAQMVLDEAARFSSEVIAPLNRLGDRQPSLLHGGKVTMTPGFKEAFDQFARGGWQGLVHPVEYGGQGLPKLIATPCIEMFNAANLSFALCPLLTDSAIETLLTAGSDAQKSLYVPKLLDGTWTGTMNLTEPQAGSDLSLVRMRAQPQGDGSYQLFGTKIFITYGEHEMADNIIHFVLARLPDAPDGVKGISLFMVPKFLVNPDGSLGARNDVHCVSLEHKLGIKASPTAVLQYGDRGGALGYLVGAPNRGLEYMFIMMNAARFAVGIQGIGVAERVYQKAAAYAKERVQGRPVDGSAPGAVAIIHHPDVRRMLVTMRALTEGARALAYVAAAHSDLARHHPGLPARAVHQAIYEYLVPIVKGWSTELAIHAASLGIQVHGGIGFIEETGIAQYYRDARVLTIYEGTTAIQANDLVGRKTVRDGGVTVQMLVTEIEAVEAQLATRHEPSSQAMYRHLSEGRRALAATVAFIVKNINTDPAAVFAGSVPYLMLAGIVLGGWQMARALLAALDKQSADPSFYEAKIATAHCYADHLLSQAPGLMAAIVSAKGGEGMLALRAEHF